MNKELSDFLIEIKSKLDNATFQAVKEVKQRAFSNITETESGFIYEVDFKKPLI
jgi:hypothetical protein